MVFLLRAGARRLLVDLRLLAGDFLRLVVVFLLLAIVFPPVERAFAFLDRVDAFLLEDVRLLAGRRGFRITTSCRGMVAQQVRDPPLI